VRAAPDRIQRLPQQYFSALLARVAEASAQPGAPVIDLGRGNPDIPPPAHVAERLAEVAALRGPSTAMRRSPAWRA
jgi:L-glutamine---4-(methylsulfanyl)-2-oxobutanoate aminotransferase